MQKMREKNKSRRNHSIGYSGTGIRTPTYRVRVCCATFTQYRYLFVVVGGAVFSALPSTFDIIPDSLSIVNRFFEKS